jgi:p-methyltransferase
MALDCVIIGHNQARFEDDLQQAQALQRHSGAFRNLLLNSTPYQGGRYSYSGLFQVLGERARDVDVFHAPSWATHYLVHRLTADGFSADMVNYYSGDSERFSILMGRAPLVVAVTSTFATDPKSLQVVVASVRDRAPGALVVVGGPFVLSLVRRGERVVQDAVFSMIDADLYVIEAQGEETLSRIVARRRKGQDLIGLPNTVCREAGQGWRRAPAVAERNPVSGVDWSIFPRDSLGRTAFMRTARSCVYDCAFCNFPQLAGGLDLAPLEDVDREFRLLCEHGVEQVIFIDDTFNIPLPRFKAICQLIIDRGYPLSWYSMFRCGNSDKDAFDLMQKSGCRGVFLGIESGSQTVLDAMRKVARIERYMHGIGELRRRGILTLASYIIGFPPETAATVEQTASFIDAAQTDYYRVQLFYYDSSTPIARNADKFGLQGGGYSWRHDGMGWEEACTHMEGIYRQTTSSVVAPANGFDLETIAYMIGNGWSVEGLHETASAAATLLQISLASAEAPRMEAAERALRDIYARNRPLRTGVAEHAQ